MKVGDLFGISMKLPLDGILSVETFEGTFDTLLAVYLGVQSI